MPDFPILHTMWPWIAGAVYLVMAVLAAGHAILHKRDVRAAIGWTGLILFSPFFGAVAYYFLGINRLRRRAARKVAGRVPTSNHPSADLPPSFDEQIAKVNHAVARTTGKPLTLGNAVTPLINGDKGYPAMLQAIGEAGRSVLLTTYIFDDDHVGRLFVDQLAEAMARGVEVRILIDGVGVSYSKPPITRALSSRGVRSALFLPTRMPLRNPYMNMRNHGKQLVVDRRVAFAGGLNIREGCMLERPSSHPVQDIHFRFEGPVVDQMFRAAHEDWYFATGEKLIGPAWVSGTESSGQVPARGIADGPDDDFETIRWTILAALGAARRSVRIATPYFLPDQPLITSLGAAALRGLDVDIVLPEENNLRFVEWASTAQLWQVLEPGCRVWLTPPPFDHSKVMVVDDAWSLVGSANWDPRSLRLNFEYNIECYDEALARQLLEYMGDKMKAGRRVSLQEVDARTVPVRLRDGIARLFAPYL